MSVRRTKRNCNWRSYAANRNVRRTSGRLEWLFSFKLGIEEDGRWTSVAWTGERERDRSSVYHRYHPEIVKRSAPALRTIAKKRRKKEKEERETTARLAKLKEVEVQEKIESIPLAPLSNNRISSPLPDPVPKHSAQVKTSEPSPRSSAKRKPAPPAST